MADNKSKSANSALAAQDISQFLISPQIRINPDLTNPVPTRDVAFSGKPTSSIVLVPGDEGTIAPFTASVSGTSLTITSGTVNGLVPTNINSTFIITGTGTEYLYLTVSTANAKVISSSLAAGAIAPSAIDVIQGQPPSSFDICIYVIVNGVPFRTIGNGSLVCTPYEAWRFAKAMTSPDSMPYDSYYSWRVSLV